MAEDNRRLTLPAVALATALVLCSSQASASKAGLVLVPDFPLLIALVALFCILVFPVNALIFRPIFRVFDAREERIAGTERRAKQLGEEADQIVERYETAVRRVREEAENDRRQSLEVARGESASEAAGARSVAEREIEAARSGIQTALEGARVSMRDEARALARLAAERVLGRAL